MAIRTYNFTFDVKRSIMPEPVFIRQNDSTGATLINVHLVDNGMPVTINGDLEFRAMTADSQNVIADTTGFSNIDIDKGAFSYALPNQLSMTPGKIRIAYFMMVDANGNASTLSFVICVKPAADLTPSGAKNYISIIDGLIKAFNEWNETAHSSWQDFVDTNKEIIESIDPGGALLTEVITVRHEMKNQSFLFQTKTGIIAHRGAHINAPENTIKAIYNAGFLGYAMVELDPQLTSDGVCVLMHDSTVDRTTNGVGAINEMTYNQANDLVVDVSYEGKNAEEVIKIPTFEEACQECQKWGMGINVDCSKIEFTEQIFKDVAGMLKHYSLWEKSFFVVHSDDTMDLFTSIYPDVNFTWLSYDADPTENLKKCKKYKNAFVTQAYDRITDELIEVYKDNDIPVFVYGCNKINDVYKYFVKGVRFVETDRILPGGMF